MKLVDAISIQDENTNAVVIGTNGATLAIYDGRDAIPESLNDADVICISCDIVNGKYAVCYTVDAE